ncbi:MAG: helix-turn-helix domain-containing protein [Magnetococcales bacterium]|nr:helix-turn-helix domain-containing protein [Magnetococcales bacterium]
MSDNQLFFRTSDAAKYLGVGKPTLEKLRLTGNGPRFSKLGKKTVLYAREDLLAWVESHKVNSTAEYR